ncbi:hypothetical protein EV182_004066, partial [Spiromyces aspiralis]
VSPKYPEPEVKTVMWHKPRVRISITRIAKIFYTSLVTELMTEVASDVLSSHRRRQNEVVGAALDVYDELIAEVAFKASYHYSWLEVKRRVADRVFGRNLLRATLRRWKARLEMAFRQERDTATERDQIRSLLGTTLSVPIDILVRFEFNPAVRPTNANGPVAVMFQVPPMPDSIANHYDSDSETGRHGLGKSQRYEWWAQLDSALSNHLSKSVPTKGGLRPCCLLVYLWRGAAPERTVALMLKLDKRREAGELYDYRIEVLDLLSPSASLKRGANWLASRTAGDWYRDSLSIQGLVPSRGYDTKSGHAGIGDACTRLLDVAADIIAEIFSAEARLLDLFGVKLDAFPRDRIVLDQAESQLFPKAINTLISQARAASDEMIVPESRGAFLGPQTSLPFVDTGPYDGRPAPLLLAQGIKYTVGQAACHFGLLAGGPCVYPRVWRRAVEDIISETFGMDGRIQELINRFASLSKMILGTGVVNPIENNGVQPPLHITPVRNSPIAKRKPPRPPSTASTPSKEASLPSLWSSPVHAETTSQSGSHRKQKRLKL